MEILDFRELMTGQPSRAGRLSADLASKQQEFSRSNAQEAADASTDVSLESEIAPRSQDRRAVSYPSVEPEPQVGDQEPIVELPEMMPQSLRPMSSGVRVTLDSGSNLLPRSRWGPIIFAVSLLAVVVGISFAIFRSDAATMAVVSQVRLADSKIVDQPDVDSALLEPNAKPTPVLVVATPVEVDAQLDVVTMMTERQQFGDAVRLLLSLESNHPVAGAEIRPTMDGVLSLWLDSQLAPGEQDYEMLEGLAYRGNLRARQILSRALDTETHNPGLLRASAKAGDVESMVELAHELTGLDRMDEAVEWFRSAADLGAADAAYCFGECRLLGKGIEADPAEGVAYLLKAAESGEHRAMDLLGVCYVRGLGVEIDHQIAVRWFQRAIDDGSSTAFFNLGVRFVQGQGVEKNVARAAELFGEGAERGNTVCMATYAKCLEAGYGVPKSLNEATIWYQKAASSGDAAAMEWCREREVGF